jgi:hypothetical protein
MRGHHRLHTRAQLLARLPFAVSDIGTVSTAGVGADAQAVAASAAASYATVVAADRFVLFIPLGVD